MKKVIILVLMISLSGVLFGQQAIPDPRIVEALGIERVNDWQRNSPDSILYYNFFLEYGYFIKEIPQVKREIFDDTEFLRLKPEFSDEKHQFSDENIADVNVLKYHFNIEKDKRTFYLINGVEKYITFYSHDHIEKGFKESLRKATQTPQRTRDDDTVICQKFQINIANDRPVHTSDSTQTSGFFYWDMCLGDALLFTASGSYPNNMQHGYPQSDATTAFKWNVKGDNSFVRDSVNSIALQFERVRGWDIMVTATDLMECPADTIFGRVRVSYSPVGVMLPVLELCPGEELKICANMPTEEDSTANGAQVILDSVGVYISAELGVADTVFLPDGNDDEYTSELEYSIFGTDQVVTNLSDIIKVKIDLEHSYIGDLSIWLECPDGSTTYFLNYPNSGSSTVLGEPAGCMMGGYESCGGTALSLLPGDCYSYFWTPTSTNGTIDNAANKIAPSWFYDSSNQNQRTLSNSLYHAKENLEYTAVGNWNNMLGCPLNGTWVVHVKDNIGRDDGYICSWSIELNPDIIPAGWGYTVETVGMKWSNETVQLSTTNCFSYTAETPGTYPHTLAIEDEYGCIWDTTFNINVAEVVYPDLGEDFFFCDGTSAELDPHLPEGNTGSLLWSDGNTTATLPITNPGTYSVTLTDNYGDIICSKSDEIEVSVWPRISISSIVANKREACSPMVVQFDNVTIPSSEEAYITYEWYIIDTTGQYLYYSKLKDPEFTIVEPGEYTVKLVVTTEHGCVDSIVRTNYLKVHKLPLFPYLGEDFGFCNETEVFLCPNEPDSSETVTYWWNTGERADTIYITTSGLYILTVTDNLTGMSCSLTDTIKVDLFRKPRIKYEVNKTEDCQPLKVRFTDQTTPLSEEKSYHWYITSSTSGALAFYSRDKNPEFIIDNPDEYTVLLMVETENGCRDTLEEKNFLTVYVQPKVEFTPLMENSILDDDGVEVYFVNHTDSSYMFYPYLSWKWDFGDETTDEVEFSPTHTYSTWGDYEVTFSVTADFGCTDQVTHIIKIEADLEFPNIITPNGDGLNDVFAIKNLDVNINPEDPHQYRSNTLYIYNRWGKKVYEEENYNTYIKNGETHVGDKYFDGEGMDDGVYYYSFHYKTHLREYTYHGSLTIMR